MITEHDIRLLASAPHGPGTVLAIGPTGPGVYSQAELAKASPGQWQIVTSVDTVAGVPDCEYAAVAEQLTFRLAFPVSYTYRVASTAGTRTEWLTYERATILDLVDPLDVAERLVRVTQPGELPVRLEVWSGLHRDLDAAGDPVVTMTVHPGGSS